MAKYIIFLSYNQDPFQLMHFVKYLTKVMRCASGKVQGHYMVDTYKIFMVAGITLWLGFEGDVNLVSPVIISQWLWEFEVTGVNLSNHNTICISMAFTKYKSVHFFLCFQRLWIWTFGFWKLDVHGVQY